MVRTAVIGVGHFGRFHAEKLASHRDAALVAVVDTDIRRAEAVAAEHGARALDDYRELLGAVDAVSIAVPTAAHHEVARFFLDNGIHVLVEKPITATLEEADDLIARARAGRLVLQVGHLERFFCARSGLLDRITMPVYLEALRISPFRPRGLDVSVIHDLMIHDIDLIATLADAPVVSVEAVGAPVLSDHEDIVNARLVFENGCVATATASRIAFKSERKIRIFQPDCLLRVDLLERRLDCIRKNSMADSPGFSVEEHALGEHDSLGSEVAGFVEAVRGGTEPLVTGEDGREALRIAEMVARSLRAHSDRVRQRMSDAARAGDRATSAGGGP